VQLNVVMKVYGTELASEDKSGKSTTYPSTKVHAIGQDAFAAARKPVGLLLSGPDRSQLPASIAYRHRGRRGLFVGVSLDGANFATG